MPAGPSDRQAAEPLKRSGLTGWSFDGPPYVEVSMSDPYRDASVPTGGTISQSCPSSSPRSAVCQERKFDWAEFLASLTRMSPTAAYQEYQRRVAIRLSHPRYRMLDEAEVCDQFEQKLARKVARGQVRVPSNASPWGFLESMLLYTIRELDRSRVRRSRRQACYLHCNPKPMVTPLQSLMAREEIGARYEKSIVSCS